MRGRLVDAATGSPIAGAWLLTLPERAWADRPETIANFRKWNAEREEELSRPEVRARAIPPDIRASLCASATTDANGEFETLVDVPWSWSEFCGVSQGPATPPARHGVQAIRVEPKGRAPVVVDVAGGTWEEDEGHKFGEVWATWDLGEVRVAAMR